jgi:hypothetical protein
MAVDRSMLLVPRGAGERSDVVVSRCRWSSSCEARSGSKTRGCFLPILLDKAGIEDHASGTACPEFLVRVPKSAGTLRMSIVLRHK